MAIDIEVLNAFLVALTAAILAWIGMMNKKRTDAAIATQETNAVIAETNQVIAAKPAYTGVDTRLRDANGKLITNQANCSQFWMNADYRGDYPDEGTRKAYTDAQLAYNNAARIADDLAEKYGKERLNDALKSIVTK